jgi:hypothetical protein
VGGEGEGHKQCIHMEVNAKTIKQKEKRKNKN